MPDKLNEMYKKWLQDAKPVEEFSLQCFQAGLTAGAVSMRQRAQRLLQSAVATRSPSLPPTWQIAEVNKLINEIGSLADIPNE